MMNLEDLQYDEYGNFIMDASEERCLDREYMIMRNYNDYDLSKIEKEIATQLINDGYFGTFDELLVTVRKLANE